MMSHANPAVFVPHAGCPNACSFCNQHAISGTLCIPTPEMAAKTFQAALESLGEKAHSAQLAFFGGSFTALDQDYRTALLEAAQPFLGAEKFSGIRISTRPDCIDDGILAELAHFGVTAIELGVQSMNDAVLAANKRGHTARDVVAASMKIKAAGFSLGHQMMTGLLGDTDAGAMETARQIAALKPNTLRIYPVLVLQDTLLERLYHSGDYTPQTLPQAVDLCGRLLSFFDRKDISVIRLGLHNEEGLGESVVAGPYHPAFRELCQSKLLLEDALKSIAAQGIPAGPLLLSVHPKTVSQMAGHQKSNLIALRTMGYLPKVAKDDALTPGAVAVSVPK